MLTTEHQSTNHSEYKKTNWFALYWAKTGIWLLSLLWKDSGMLEQGIRSAIPWAKLYDSVKISRLRVFRQDHRASLSGSSIAVLLFRGDVGSNHGGFSVPEFGDSEVQRGDRYAQLWSNGLESSKYFVTTNIVCLAVIFERQLYVLGLFNGRFFVCDAVQWSKSIRNGMLHSIFYIFQGANSMHRDPFIRSNSIFSFLITYKFRDGNEGKVSNKNNPDV